MCTIKCFAAASLACALAACGTEPQLAQFAWSRDALPPAGFSQWNEPVAESSAGGVVVSVWSTTYARQDMSKARGWIETTPSEVVLCFAAPDRPSQPSSAATDAAASAAYPTLLTYRLSGPDYTSNTRFGRDCSGP